MNFLRISQNHIPNTQGKFNFIHDSYLDNGTAFEISDTIKVSFEIPRLLGVSELVAEIYNENFSNLLIKLNLPWRKTDLGFDKYDLNLKAKALGIGLYFVKLYAKSTYGKIYFKRAKLGMKSTIEDTALFQLTVSDFKYEKSDEYTGGIIYHVFVDRFNKGKGNCPKRDNAVLVDDWDSDVPEFPQYPGAYLENNTFFGGNLFGVTEKLDYLKSLGTNLIYLSPIFKAYSNHKYDTGDYMTVDEMFGGEEALKELIASAREKGIGIILDGVFNHTGADSIYFNKFNRYDKVGAFQSKDSEFYPWYDFKSYPNDYTSWWGIDILPRIKPDFPTCSAYFTDENGVIDKYSKMGVAGFRLDVADELSDNFIEKIKDRQKANDKNAILYGEVWEDASNKIAYDTRKRYYLGRELDGVMNYPAREAIISFLRNGNTNGLFYLFAEIIPNAPKRIRDLQMNLLGTHDTPRIITALGGENPEGKTNAYLKDARMNEAELEKAIKLLLLAYTVSATIPGIPSIYYGDEVLMEGYSDPFNRRTFPKNNINEEILDFYKKIGKIRRENSVYKSGGLRVLTLTPELLIFERFKEKTRLITVINNSDKDLSLEFYKQAHALIKNVKGKIITVSPLSSEIIKIN